MTEYEIWYDAADGARRVIRAPSKAAVKERITEIKADEWRRVLLAASVGVDMPERELNIEILQVTTSTKAVTI